MKQSFRYTAALLLAITFSASALAEMNSRESKRIEQGKITKNEAQHLVQNAYPGAKINRCELKRSKDHGVWIVDLVKTGENKASRVEVDGRTGKISPQAH